MSKGTLRIGTPLWRRMFYLLVSHTIVLFVGFGIADNYNMKEQERARTHLSEEHAAVTVDNLALKLNEYRIINGKKQLGLDLYLSDMAQKSMQISCPDGKIVTDHSGFEELRREGAFKNYFYVSENNASGRTTTIEYIEDFSKSLTHNDAMLDPTWGGVGIGINGQCVSFIFAK